MFSASAVRALKSARDACVSVKPMQEFIPKLLEVAPDFAAKANELNDVTDYLERFVAVALAAVGE